MKISDIESLLSYISADANSIHILTTEACEGVEPNSPEFLKIHAASELAENQIRLVERIEDGLIELRRMFR